MARPKEGNRPAIEGRDPVDAESLGGSHEQGIGEARTVLRHRIEQFDRPGQVGLRWRDEAYRATGHGTDERERGRDAELVLEEHIEGQPSMRTLAHRWRGDVKSCHHLRTP